ncbi:MAG: peptide deformylase [Gammaproteobacteria bacterium]|nr:MAG: peptide deformylase [Gammaproteobacteria bacterium]
MALLPILRFPDPRLRTVAKPVGVVDDKIKQLIENMFDTMYKDKGVGLAATQVNRHIRVVVTDCAAPEDEPQPIAFVNPELLAVSEETDVHQEGCLSIPENYADVERPKCATVKAMDKDGKEFILECEGLLATCIQHEIDHLNGKLFIDHLSPAKQLLVREKMKKYEKRLAREAKKSAKSPIMAR